MNPVVPPPLPHSQVELHPYLVQTDMIEFCRSKNIALIAFSPLGSPGRPPEMSVTHRSRPRRTSRMILLIKAEASFGLLTQVK